MIMQLKKSIAVLILLFSVNSYATPIVFNNSAAFNAAISNYTTATLDFEGSTALDLIADGGMLGGITFDYTALNNQGILMQIHNTYSATSGTNYLGTDTGGAFLGGDTFSLSFASVNAFGLFFLSGSELLDGDISLTVGTTITSLSSVFEAQLTDGSYVYFLGLLDNTNAFGSVNVVSLSAGNFEFNVDDITTTTAYQVPTPPVLWLLLIGFMPLLRNSKTNA